MIVVSESRGEILVLDRGPAVIKRFRSDGTFLGTIGREGGGPGEFRNNGILYLVGDTLAHHDQNLGRLSIFTHEGAFVRATSGVSHFASRLPADKLGRIPLPIDRALPNGRVQDGVARYGLDGTVADSLWYPPPFEARYWSVERAAFSGAMPIPFTPERVDRFDRAGDLIWGQQDEGKFVVSHGGTDTTRLIEAAFPALPASDLERQAAFDSAVARRDWLVGTARLEDIPSEHLRWKALEVDGAEHLWVRRPATPTREVWSVFDHDGRWLGDVPAPFGDVTSSYWGRERIYLLTVDSTGFPQIEIWRIQTLDP